MRGPRGANRQRDGAERAEHLALLRRALELELRDDVREAFEGMLEKLTNELPARCAGAPIWYERWSLTEKEERWVRRALGEELPEPDARLTDGAIPRGREVPTPAVLLNRPAKPPGHK